ncbi:MAG TPA: hypothetical protein VEC12_13195 [Bacteroidia bacterium]|nr:hypothetical protein [Bacteroidia bacterium]
MRAYILLMLMIGVRVTACAQGMTIDELIKYKQDTIGTYDTAALADNQVFLAMDFASPVIKNPLPAYWLDGKYIYKVELVYTAYRQSETFEQPRLNRNRLEELKKMLPGIFTEFMVDWKFIAQKSATEEAGARKLFHGFIISYIERDMLTITDESGYMQNVLNNDSLGQTKIVVKERYKIKKRREYTGMYFPRNKKKRKEGVTYDKKGWFREKHYYLEPDTIGTYYDTTLLFEPGPFAGEFVRNHLDTTFFTVMERNNWKKVLVVCDVTGSMSPYSTQVLVWHKLYFNAGRSCGYVFFNDGNDTPDTKKVMGKTGGLYFSAGNAIKAVEDTALRAMHSGGGGDVAENNIEAILGAVKKFPDCDEIIMIADNWADMKDFKLAKQVKKPVHVILCGVGSYPLNPQYLELARMTKGSVHTLESDITVLSKMNNGQTVDIDKYRYLLKSGKFTPIMRLD